MKRLILTVVMVMVFGMSAFAVTEVVDPASSYEITNVLVSTGPAGYATKIVNKTNQSANLTIKGARISKIAITNEDPTYTIYVGTLSTVTANPVTSPVGQGRDTILPFQTLIINTNRDMWAIGPITAAQRHSTITVTTEYQTW